LLYRLHEAIRSSSASLEALSRTAVSALKNPASPWSNHYSLKAASALVDVFDDWSLNYSKPDWLVRDLKDKLGQCLFQEELIDSKPFCKLIRFYRQDLVSRTGLPKLLVVAPLAGHYATLLRGTVETLVQNFDVYVTDWRNARDVAMEEGSFSFDTYVDYIHNFVELLGENSHILAVCQPGPAVIAAVSLMAEENSSFQPKTLTLIGSPIDTRQSPTAPNLFAQSRPLSWFEQNAVMDVPKPHKGVTRLVYPGFMQLGGFMGMNMGKHIEAYRSQLRNLFNEDTQSDAIRRNFYREYFSVMDLTAEFYLDTIKIVFQEHHLAKGLMTHRGRKVDPSYIQKTALFTIEGGKDDVSGSGQTRAAHDLCTNLPKEMHAKHIEPDVGHYGIFNGRQWRESIAPKIRDFVCQHSDS
jgi:poly(3-hydroxybutyrate) depolymerase